MGVISTPEKPLHDSDAEGQGQVIYDAVFGELSEEGPNYRSVSTFGALILLIKSNFGLGVLTIPAVFDMLGIVPGIILIFTIQFITSYCAMQVGSFKRNHPPVYGLADAVGIVGGRWAKEFMYYFIGIYYIVIISSAIVSISTALNAVSVHGACTAIFIMVGAVGSFVIGSVRTLGTVTWIGWMGLISLLAAVITLTVAVGVGGRPYAAPQVGPWDKGIKVAASPSFAVAMSAVDTILFSYGASPMFWNIASEMKNPKAFNTVMFSSMTLITAVYLVIGGVVYHYCGQYVASPALGSAGPLMKRVSYGLALPSLFATTTIYAHCAGKHLFVRVLQGSRHLTSNSMTHYLTWFACMAANVVLGYVFASAVPNFGSIISLIGAIVLPSVCIWPYACLWWYDNWKFTPKDERSRKLYALMVVNVAVFFIGVYITGAGTYGAVMDVIKTTANAGPWSCKDNSGSV